MLFWIVLLVFGVPLVAVIIQSVKTSKARNDRLDEIQKRLAEKQQEAIDSKLATMKEKRQKSRPKTGNCNVQDS
ncbi:hypothetical protein ACJJI3_07515 [Microbulbifer sp. ZKSA004]|uniref:hypothetical protein n=1 Tax=Microbulbifer sp. ZKSA004 TaxID=3243389 RepID=UPI00403A5840